MKLLIRIMWACAAVIWSTGAVARAADQDFKWSWEKGGGGATQSVAEARTAEDGAKGVDAEAYSKLLKENLDLRKRIADSSQGQETAKKENERLMTQVRDLEKKIEDFSVKVQRVKEERNRAAGDPDKLVELESKLAAAEAEKGKLAAELAALQERASGKPESAAAPAIAPGSDLYRDLQKENVALKEKLSHLQSEKQDVLQELQETEVAAAKGEDLKKEMAETEASGEKRKEIITALARKLPALETELAEMRTSVRAKDRELAAMKLELDRRDQRLKKAERIAALLIRARREVRGSGEKEARDIHYNMAVLYASKGQNEEAEREYLSALRADPTDADAHYNLGILYDEAFKNKDKAAMHYRRFLKLRPDSPEAFTVREWLIYLETP